MPETFRCNKREGTRRRIATLALLGVTVALTTTASACARRTAPEALVNPAAAALGARAPDSFHVTFETSRGRFVVAAHRSWAPLGVDRFYYLVQNRFYDETRFFRVLPNFVAQFGLHGDPVVAAAWKGRVINDDRVRQSNRRGTLSFAHGGPRTRTTQVFINLVDNQRLDNLQPLGFAPFARVISGMEVVDRLYSGYGEGPPRGRGPSQDTLAVRGNAYLDRHFPRLDRVRTARVTNEWRRQTGR
jgi:peptidyl-prolyl cis-trans isomerase A (cyclophilin A)